MEEMKTVVKSKENKPYNLEHYIRSHAHNHHSRPLVIKKGKSSSIINIISREQGPRSIVQSKKTSEVRLSQAASRDIRIVRKKT